MFFLLGYALLTIYEARKNHAKEHIRICGQKRMLFPQTMEVRKN